MLLESKRKETFEVFENMLNIRKHLMELCMRRFGLKQRKEPKIPKNFDQWSDESKKKHLEKAKANFEAARNFDESFIQYETTVINDMCRQIIFLIDRANSINPQLLCECDSIRTMQDEAIGLCKNLLCELNYIAETIPCNKNFLAKMTDDINKEISLLTGWRKKYNKKRLDVMIKEIKSRKNAAEKIGFIINLDDLITNNEVCRMINEVREELNDSKGNHEK